MYRGLSYYCLPGAADDDGMLTVFLRFESGIPPCIFPKKIHLLNNFLRRKTLSVIVQKRDHNTSYYSTLKVLTISSFVSPSAAGKVS